MMTHYVMQNNCFKDGLNTALANQNIIFFMEKVQRYLSLSMKFLHSQQNV